MKRDATSIPDFATVTNGHNAGGAVYGYGRGGGGIPAYSENPQLDCIEIKLEWIISHLKSQEQTRK